MSGSIGGAQGAGGVNPNQIQANEAQQPKEIAKLQAQPSLVIDDSVKAGDASVTSNVASGSSAKPVLSKPDKNISDIDKPGLLEKMEATLGNVASPEARTHALLAILLALVTLKIADKEDMTKEFATQKKDAKETGDNQAQIKETKGKEQVEEGLAKLGAGLLGVGMTIVMAAIAIAVIVVAVVAAVLTAGVGGAVVGGAGAAIAGGGGGATAGVTGTGVAGGSVAGGASTGIASSAGGGVTSNATSQVVNNVAMKILENFGSKGLSQAVKQFGQASAKSAANPGDKMAQGAVNSAIKGVIKEASKAIAKQIVFGNADIKTPGLGLAKSGAKGIQSVAKGGAKGIKDIATKTAKGASEEGIKGAIKEGAKATGKELKDAAGEGVKGVGKGVSEGFNLAGELNVIRQVSNKGFIKGGLKKTANDIIHPGKKDAIIKAVKEYKEGLAPGEKVSRTAMRSEIEKSLKDQGINLFSRGELNKKVKLEVSKSLRSDNSAKVAAKQASGEYGGGIKGLGRQVGDMIKGEGKVLKSNVKHKVLNKTEILTDFRDAVKGGPEGMKTYANDKVMGVVNDVMDKVVDKMINGVIDYPEALGGRITEWESMEVEIAEEIERAFNGVMSAQSDLLREASTVLEEQRRDVDKVQQVIASVMESEIAGQKRAINI